MHDTDSPAFGAGKRQRRTKLIDLPEARSLIASTMAAGGLLALGGLFKQNRPTALVREVLRARLSGLKLISSPGAGYDVDLLIAAGAVAETFLAAVTLEDRLCPNFRDAVEAGRIKAHAVDALTIVGGLMAAANGVSFQPVQAWKGSDVVALNPLIKPMPCPFTQTPTWAVRAIVPTLALLHAQEADRHGNVRYLSTMTYTDQLLARASKRVIVSVDRIVPDDRVLDEPTRTSIPGIYVDAVVEIPYGAHPTGSFPLYSIDEAFIESFAELSESARRKRPGAAQALQASIDSLIAPDDDQFAYVEKIGGYRRLAPLEQEARSL